MATKVRVETGREGPAYDPYGFEEITVTRNDHEYILHAGLLVWVAVDGVREVLYDFDYENGGCEKFKFLTGYEPSQWVHWYYEGRQRCRKCGGTRLKEGGGMAGEATYWCARCGTFVYDDFHLSMIQ